MRKILLSIVLVLFVAAVAQASAFGSGALGPAGGGGGGVSSALVCLLSGGAGCTMTGQTIYSGVATDVTTANNQDLTLAAPGTGSVALKSGDGTVDIFSPDAGSVGNVLINNSGVLLARGTLAGAVVIGGATWVGTSDNKAGSVLVGCFGDSVNAGTGGTCLYTVYGAGLRASAVVAAVVGNPTDTSTTPSSSNFTISATAAAAWTPGESGIVDGMEVEAINTGTFVVTMTEAAGQYEGPATACALGQYDAVTFRYVTDRWVQTSCSDN